jgi:hypothetical protein
LAAFVDVKSILRVFRFTEQQAKAERDPDAKRPPTVKFLAVALALGLVMVLVSFWSAPSSTVGGTLSLSVEPSPSPDAGNATTDPAPTTGSPHPLVAQGPPARSVTARDP